MVLHEKRLSAVTLIACYNFPTGQSLFDKTRLGLTLLSTPSDTTWPTNRGSSSPPSSITSLVIANDVKGIIVPKAAFLNGLRLTLQCETMACQKPGETAVTSSIRRLRE